MPEFRQLLSAMSMMRYFPARGTAGLARSLVSGHSRAPRPPPRINPNISRLAISAPNLPFDLQMQAPPSSPPALGDRRGRPPLLLFRAGLPPRTTAPPPAARRPRMK